MNKLKDEDNYITDALESFGIIYGFDEDMVTSEDADAIRKEADKIFAKAVSQFNEYLNNLGYEQAMGIIVKRV